jgi:D-serine dehydratase
VDDAHARLNRFAPYLAKAFPAAKGIIESELVAIPAMQARLEKRTGIPGTLLLKKTAICRSPARLKRAAASMRC